jgi:hypothetical protein
MKIRRGEYDRMIKLKPRKENNNVSTGFVCCSFTYLPSDFAILCKETDWRSGGQDNMKSVTIESPVFVKVVGKMSVKNFEVTISISWVTT